MLETVSVISDGIRLAFDPDMLLRQLPEQFDKSKVQITEHCGVCKARNGILRTHSTVIHFDEESPDFQDDPFPWSYIHPDEDASWLP